MVNLSGTLRAKNEDNSVEFSIIVDTGIGGTTGEANEAVAALRVAMREFHDLKGVRVSAEEVR